MPSCGSEDWTVDSTTLRAGADRVRASGVSIPSAGTLCVPSGTPDSRPPFQRWESVPDNRQVPSGTAEAGDHRGHEQSAIGHTGGFCRPCRGCWPRETRGPTDESVGDDRESLPGQRGVAAAAKVVGVSIFAECHALEALACRFQRGRWFLRTRFLTWDRTLSAFHNTMISLWIRAMTDVGERSDVRLPDSRCRLKANPDEFAIEEFSATAGRQQTCWTDGRHGSVGKVSATSSLPKSERPCWRRRPSR